jgi:hypothetical protein
MPRPFRAAKSFARALAVPSIWEVVPAPWRAREANRGGAAATIARRGQPEIDRLFCTFTSPDAIYQFLSGFATPTACDLPSQKTCCLSLGWLRRRDEFGWCQVEAQAVSANLCLLVLTQTVPSFPFDNTQVIYRPICWNTLKCLIRRISREQLSACG